MASTAFPPLLKHSPLSTLYRQFSIEPTVVAGWHMAAHFGNLKKERHHLETGAVMADWSHIGKIALSCRTFAAKTTQLIKEATEAEPRPIAPLRGYVEGDRLILRLTTSDLLLLCPPGQEATLLDKLNSSQFTITNQTGAMGCFALAGPRRDEVLERSTAMDLRRDRVQSGAVVQTTVHTIRCTLYRTDSLDILLHPRSLSESLFDALLDVGIGVGLAPTGLSVLPVQLAV